MAIVEFKKPAWLTNTSARTIGQNMMKNLPRDIDKTEGGWAWDLTFPTALEKAEMLELYLPNALKTMFHMWAEGEWLDYHAADCGLERRAANPAYGHVTVTGKAGRVIPKGFIFAVPADDNTEAIDFESLEEATIGDEGTVDIAVQAVVPGKGGNVPADSITIMRSPIKGIENITNEAAMTGGAAKEDDDTLRQRIDDYWAGTSHSMVGNNADYVRWAKEVPGVGYAHTIPEYNGPNSVKVVVADTDGLPANEQILANVLLHIFGTNRKDINRIAPVGVIDYVVAAPTSVKIDYSFKLKIKDGYTVEDVQENFREALADYYAEITAGEWEGATVQYIQTHAALADATAGVADFYDFKMNGAEENITFAEDEYPLTGDIEVTLYE